MSSFTVIKLAPERLDEAYPLIRAATHIGQRRWHAYARLLAKCGGGILAVASPDNRIHGIASYRAENTLRHARALIVDAVAAFEFHAHSPIRNQLFEALKCEAQRRQCDTLVITATVPREMAAAGDSALPWLSLKFDVETITLVHKLTAR